MALHARGQRHRQWLLEDWAAEKAEREAAQQAPQEPAAAPPRKLTPAEAAAAAARSERRVMVGPRHPSGVLGRFSPYRERAANKVMNYFREKLRIKPRKVRSLAAHLVKGEGEQGTMLVVAKAPPPTLRLPPTSVFVCAAHHTACGALPSALLAREPEAVRRVPPAHPRRGPARRLRGEFRSRPFLVAMELREARTDVVADT